jgi:diaminopimelate epimerase
VTSAINFLKMDGLGNQFVIIDARETAIELTSEQIRTLADPKNPETQGCDQLGVMLADEHSGCYLMIYNADGSEVDTCGNLLRCVAQLLMKEIKKGVVSLRTNVGLMTAALVGANLVKVDMGEPKFGWLDIPLTHMVDTMHLPLVEGELKDGVAVSMGNPHAVFFVESAHKVDLATLGPKLETDSLFPERANIGVAHVVGEDLIRLRVWERGTGETKACGSGACAAVVAAHSRGLTARHVTVVLPGGELDVEWLASGRVMMTGPVNYQFEGVANL